MITAEDLSTLKTLEETAEVFRRGKPTVQRWITHGVAIGSGRVKLAAFRVGGQWMIPPDAINAFLAATNPDATPVPESPAAQSRRFEAERKQLAALVGGR